MRDLSEDVYFWVRWANDDSEEGTQDTLTIPIIVNEEMGYGIYSYERQTPYEEAQSTLNTYQASYDAAEEELKKQLYSPEWTTTLCRCMISAIPA